MFCEKCGIKMAENGNYCLSCGTTAKKTLSWWNKLSLPKKIVIGFVVGFIAFQGLNFVIAVPVCSAIHTSSFLSKSKNSGPSSGISFEN